MMKKCCEIIIALLAVVSFSVEAENVSQKQASKIAETFFNASYGQVMTPPKLIWNGRQLTTDRLFSPFYIYNHPAGGFVIISADSKAFPIIGYSRSNAFSRETLGEDEKELLTKYAHEIELIRYDSRMPVRAKEAWSDIRGYIAAILENPYDTPEFRELTPTARENLENVDRRNGWIMLPSAVEFNIYDSEKYRGYTLDDVLGEAEQEDVPFQFFEEFLKSVHDEELSRAAALDEIISPTKPVVTPLGGAHFKIYIPEDVRLMRIYDMNGASKIEHKFLHSNVVNVDLSSVSPGFYVAMILSESGRIYGIKLYR